jgi:hypothetical protein
MGCEGSFYEETTLMKLTVLAILAAITVNRALNQTSIVKADGGCTNKNLSGSYTYALSGEYFNAASDLYHFSAVGRVVFDGLGALNGTDSISDGALITRGRQYTGNYVVNADCTGNVTMQTGAGTSNLDIVVTNNNRNLNLIQTDRYTNLAGTAQQQFPPQTPVQ